MSEQTPGCSLGDPVRKAVFSGQDMKDDASVVQRIE